MESLTVSVIPIKIDMDQGSFPIAHTALLTLSKTKLSGAQRAIVDIIFTQTYGYHCESSPHEERIKKRYTKALIPYEFFEQATWMGKQEVSRAISSLIKWGIIGRDKNTVPITYWFNVYVSEWSKECWRISRIANCKQDSELLTETSNISRIANSKQDSELLTETSNVSRIANSKQDSEKGVSRIANSKQDSEKDVSRIANNSSQDSEQGVSRIANSKQVSDLQPQGIEEPLKKDLNNNNDHDDDDRASEYNRQDLPEGTELLTTFEKEFGRPLSPFEVEQIEQWAEQNGALLVVEALKRAVLRGKHNFKYINSILSEWQKNNLRTVQAIQEYDADFQARRDSKTGQARQRGAPGVTRARSPDPKREKKKEIIRSLYV
ncbi:MAG: DNA replication protein DnaD [Pelotomaculum sp. PtaU1.Bin065]|nr:MAG: DNA replication protein DnaD [Pelotomaculum sp. PtaU1.Bin065]